MASRFSVKDRVRVSKESLPGYPETMRLGWVLEVIEDGARDVTYEVAVSLGGQNWYCPPSRWSWLVLGYECQSA